MMSNGEKNSGSFDLDLRALGALDEKSDRALSERLEREPLLRARLEENQQAMDKFRREVMPKTLPTVEKRLLRSSKSPLFWAVPLLAAAGALLIMLQIDNGSNSPLEEAGLRAKGDPIIQIFAKRGQKQFLVKEGQNLRQNDVLKFVVQPVDFQHVLVFGLSGTDVETWAPFNGKESLSIAGKSEITDTVILDDATGSETVVAVFSEQPLKAADWTKQVTELKPGAVSEGVFVVHFSWNKE